MHSKLQEIYSIQTELVQCNDFDLIANSTTAKQTVLCKDPHGLDFFKEMNHIAGSDYSTKQVRCALGAILY